MAVNGGPAASRREDAPPAQFRDYLKILRKHWWLMTAIFIVTVVTVAIWTLNQVPIYRASALVPPPMDSCGYWPERSSRITSPG